MVNNILNTVGTKFFSAVFNFLILLVTANYMGTQGRGEISILIASLTILLLFTNFVGGNTLTYLAPRKPVSTLLLISYCWTILISALAFFCLYLTKSFAFSTCIHISVLSILFSATSIHSSILVGKEQIETANKIGLTQVIVHFFLLSISLIFFDQKNISIFIYSLYFSYSLALLWSAWSIREFVKPALYANWGKTLLLALGLGTTAQLANIFQFLNYRLDIYLLNAYDNLSNLGIYTSAVAIAESVLLLGGSFALVQFSKIANTENEPESRNLSIRLTRYSVLLSIIAYLPLFIFPDEFYNFLLGKDFHNIRMLLLAIAPGIIFLGSSVTISHYFAGTGKYKINALASFCGLLVTLILGIIFIPKYGIIAAAFVSSISYTISTLVLIIFFLKSSETKIKDLFPTLADLKFLQKSILNVRDKRNR
jgi:O-antigen/teichoic acid export membrane protein